MSNFDFILKNGIFKTFAEASLEAEKSIAVANVSCTILCRRALELAVKWIYANDRELVLPYQNNLSSLVYDINFKSMINEKVFNGMTYIIKLGNFSVHSNKKVTRKEAVLCLKYLFDFMDWLAYYYDSNYIETKFDEGKLPAESSANLKKENSQLYFKHVLDILINIFKRKNVSGSSYLALTIEKFKKMKMIIPPIDLQNQFSEIVKQIDKQKFESMIQLKMMEKIYNIINDRRRYV